MENLNTNKRHEIPLIAPSILSADFSNIALDIRRMEEAGADILHCDVMDGIFVPNITFGPKFIKDIRKVTKLPLDVHLMITKPERYIDSFIDAGADYLTIHYEATDILLPTLEKIKNRGIKAGTVISPDTPVDVLKEALVLSDIVLLMSVYPGFGGQKFIEKSLSRLEELVALAKEISPNCLIEIDGGVTLENASAIKKAGADILVAGNTVFTSPNPKQTIAELKSI
ncbi:MAG: ribulose-phosphate 3-epimerase [Firmicutes bacterium]|nr:ribulose-phosphate 3-epimerase [Bacillota bacterium]